MKAKYRPKLNGGVLQRRWEKGEQLFKYEEDYLWTFLRDKADTTFQRWIRNRDKNKDCITGDVPTCQHKIMNACHWLDRAWYSHRYREDNVFGGCVSCNKYHAQAHGSSLENLQTRRYGIEWVDKQYRERNKIPPTIEELVQIINRYS